MDKRVRKVKKKSQRLSLPPKKSNIDHKYGSENPNQLKLVRAKVAYAGKTGRELTFKKDEVLTIIRSYEVSDGEQWFLGKDCYGNVGMFPSSAVQEIRKAAGLLGRTYSGSSIASSKFVDARQNLSRSNSSVEKSKLSFLKLSTELTSAREADADVPNENTIWINFSRRDPGEILQAIKFTILTETVESRAAVYEAFHGVKNVTVVQQSFENMNLDDFDCILCACETVLGPSWPPWSLSKRIIGSLCRFYFKANDGLRRLGGENSEDIISAHIRVNYLGELQVGSAQLLFLDTKYVLLVALGRSSASLYHQDYAYTAMRSSLLRIIRHNRDAVSSPQVIFGGVIQCTDPLTGRF